MYSINTKLKELEENNNPIRVSIVGAGLMGKGLVSQLMLVKGMVPSLVVSHKIQDTIEAYTLAGIARDDIKIAKSLEEINLALEENKYVVTDTTEYATKANLIDVVVDATGVPNTGAEIAFDAILNKKHIVMLNIEADVVVGPILNQLAKNAGLLIPSAFISFAASSIWAKACFGSATAPISTG